MSGRKASLAALIASFALLVAGGGCSILFDGSRHQGGTPDAGAPSQDGGSGDGSAGDAGKDAGPADAGTDAGPPDAGAPDGGCDDDGDGFLSMACGGNDCNDTRADQYPGAPPICGDGMTQSCPGDVYVDPAPYGSSLAVAGLLPPMQLGDMGTYAANIALAGTNFGGNGFGTAMAIAVDQSGAQHHFVRWDVPLDMPSGAMSHGIMARAFPVSGPTVMLDLTTDVNAEGVALEEEGSGTIGLALLCSVPSLTQVLGFRGILDPSAGEMPLGQMNFAGSATAAYPDPAIAGGMMMVREGPSSPTLAGLTLPEDPIAISAGPAAGATGPGRMIGSDDGYGLLQLAGGPACFFDTSGDGVQCGTSGPATPAAFAHLGSNHLYAVPGTGGSITLMSMDCSTGSTCMPAPVVSPPPSISTGAPVAAAFDLIPRPAGGGLLVYGAEYSDGEVLAVQPVLDNGNTDGDHIDVLDLRGTNQQVLDAEGAVVQTSRGVTVAIAATVGDLLASTATHVVFTGIRACAMN